MIYLYSDYNKKYQEYKSKFNLYCLSHFGCSIDQMKSRKILNEEMLETLQHFEEHSPFIDSDCPMNHLCHYLEKEIKEIKARQKKTFQYYDLMLTRDDILCYNEKISLMDDLYKKYVKLKYDQTSDEQINDNIPSSVKKIKLLTDLKNEACHTISSNEKELASLAVDLTYKINQSYKKEFAWDVFADGLINNIIHNTDGIAKIPMVDENGSFEYLYTKYSFKELNLL